jgi:acyl dehydratase
VTISVGDTFGPSRWLEVTQDRIGAFADATEDHQWIHVDAARAAGGPFGTTIAHGLLTLSLVIPLWNDVFRHDGTSVNYGLDHVRFPAPVPSGSRIRAHFRVESVEEVAGGVQAKLATTIEREGADKPVCVAELILRLLA